MSCKCFVLVALALVVGGASATAQTFSARRMAMGGVVLAGGGSGSEGANVAYRAVPPPAGTGTSIVLPLGLIQALSDMPEWDPNAPDFNAYRIADLLYNPPWHLQLVSPDPPSNDILIAVGKDHLAVDLGDVKGIIPEDASQVGTVVNAPSIGVGRRGAFVALAPLVEVRNDFDMNEALRRALQGDAFQPATRYRARDDGHAQAAAALHLGWARALHVQGDPRGAGRALYAGARLKVLRGLAYGRADNQASFTTSDTLFATDPVDVGYEGYFHEAGPDGGRWGRGLDLGAVWMWSGAELGLGVDDIGTRIDWRVRESRTRRDNSGQYVEEVLSRDRAVRTTVPTTATLNAAVRLPRVLLAADVVRDVAATTAHAGAETWFGNVALRAGALLDGRKTLQGAVGGGYRFGRFGLDLALATHSRNLMHERALELGVGLSLY